MADRAAKAIAIILVHGTWSRNKFKELRIHLTRELSTLELHFIDFDWNGHNRIWARSKASDKLASRLVQVASDPNFDRCMVVAHSHGGNVAFQAIRKANLEHAIPLFCLATPFLLPGPARTDLGDGSVLTAGAIAFATFASLTLWGHSLKGSWFMSAVFAGMIAWVVLGILGVLVETAKDMSEHAVSDYGVVSLRQVDLYIYQNEGDEARTGLVITRFLNDAVATIFEMATGIVVFTFLCTTWIVGALVVIDALIFLRTGHSRTAHLLRIPTDPGLFGALLLAGCGISVVVVFAWIAGALALAVVATPLLVLLSLSMLPFGIDASLMALNYSLSVRDEPPGDGWHVRLFKRNHHDASLAHWSICSRSDVLSEISSQMASLVDASE